MITKVRYGSAANDTLAGEMENRSVVGPSSDARANPDRVSLVLALVGLGLAVAIGIVAAGHGLEHLWRGDAFYGHAYAIPLVVAYLVYE